MDWMFLSPQNSYVEILTPKVMVVGGGDFRRWLGHEGGDFMNEISALIKETPGTSLAPSAMWVYGGKMAIYEPESGPPAN